MIRVYLLGAMFILGTGTGVKAQTVSGSLQDSLIKDVNGNGVVNPGDSLRYKATLKNSSGTNATGVNYDNPTPSGTTLGIATVRTSALARNDAWATAFNMVANSNNVLSNDYGLPAPAVLSYGPTASPSATAAGSAGTTNGGGSITISAAGQLSYTPAAGFTGYDKFTYIATTGTQPDNTATVTIAVGNPASAAADAYNVVGNVHILDNVKANDGGDATLVTAVKGNPLLVGVATTSTNGGNITVNADGSFTYNPPAGFEGSDNFTYTIDNGFNAPSTATVTLTVSGMIWFVNNSGANGDGRLSSPFNSLAGVSNGGGNSAANDNIFIYSGSGAYSGGITLLAGQKLIGQGAQASLSSILGYTLPAYSAALPATAGTAPTITNGGGNGITLGNTNTLRGLSLGTASGSAIGGTSFGTLSVSEVSINTTGQGLSLNTGTVNGTISSLSSTGGTNNVSFTSCAGSLAISGGTLTGTASGAGFSVNGGTLSVITGQSMSQGAAAALVSVSGGHTGTLTFQTGSLSASNGTGLQFDNADGTYNFDGTATLSGGDAGIDITNGSSGNFTFANAPITNPTGAAFLVNGGSGTISHTGAISKNSTGRLIDIQSRTGGSVTIASNLSSTASSTGINVSSCSGGTLHFNGLSKTLSTGSVAAVTLASNGGSTINFANGGLAITTSSGAGFNATGGAAAINVTGSGNTISSTTGTALNVANSTIGSSGLTFQSISANGAANGIVLNTTGSNGGLTVTGDGTNWGSGGTIQNTSGADGATAGNGVYLNNTRNISFAFMKLNDHSNHAIYGTNITAFTMTKTRVTGTNGGNVGVDEGSISFDNLYGSVSITNSYVSGGAEDNIRVVNGFPVAATASLNRFTMTTDTVGANGTTGNNGVNIAGYGTAVMNATIENSKFSDARSNHVSYVINENASGDVIVNNNIMTNNHPNKLGSGIIVMHASSGNVTYAVSNNSVNGAVTAGIEVDRGAGGTGSMTGSITGNTVGTSGLANSGSSQSSGIFVGLVGTGLTATHTSTISNNTIRQFTNYGIGGTNSGTGTGYLNLTINNNNIAEPSAAAVSTQFPTSGIRFTLGVSSGPPAHDGKTCFNIFSNTISQTGTSISAEIRLFGRFSSKTSILGLGQNGASADPNTYINNKNTITVAPGGLGAVNATSTNAFQSNCPPI